jgi:outer membrane protein assembly factor BamB
VHIFDLNGNHLKSVKPNEKLENPLGIYVLDNEIFIGNCDVDEPQIFVYDFDFRLKRKFGDFNLSSPQYLIIDKEYNKNNLYVSDGDNKTTIWEAKSGMFIDKIDIETPMEINFTKQSLYALSGIPFGNAEIINNKVEKIIKGGNCIYEIDKNSLEIKRKIIGEWFSPGGILKLLFNGNLQTTAYTFDKNRIKSEFRYLLTLDKNGRILSQILLDDIQSISDVAVVDNKIIITFNNTMKIFEFDNSDYKKQLNRELIG